METILHLFCLFINWLVQLRCLCSAASNTLLLHIVKVTYWCQSSAYSSASGLAQIDRAFSIISFLQLNPINILKHYFSLAPHKTKFIYFYLVCAIFERKH